MAESIGSARGDLDSRRGGGVARACRIASDGPGRSGNACRGPIGIGPAPGAHRAAANHPARGRGFCRHARGAAWHGLRHRDRAGAGGARVSAQTRRRSAPARRRTAPDRFRACDPGRTNRARAAGAQTGRRGGAAAIDTDLSARGFGAWPAASALFLCAGNSARRGRTAARLRRTCAAGGRAMRPGWPAPERPEDAIDEAEFDLALLDRLGGGDAESTQGAAHYLLSANPHLARALRARARRWRRLWTRNDGMVDPEPAEQTVLAAHRTDARSYSATALQHYAACPYRFFLYAIQRLEPREEIEAIDAIDPLTRGALFHEVQYEILTALRAAGALPVTAQTLPEAQAALETHLERVAAIYRERLWPAIERVWLDGIDSIRADLREWLRRMAEEAQLWRPERFELAFGLKDRAQADPASVAAPIDLGIGLNLRGSIDLVERGPNGELRITDYKTGRVRADRNLIIGGGRILQPALYAMAAERILGESVLAGRLYYCTATGGFEERVVALDERTREAAAQFAMVVSGAIAEGFLPAAPARGECEYCNYRRVCGPYEEARVNHKTDEAADEAAGRKLNAAARRLEPLWRLR